MISFGVALKQQNILKVKLYDIDDIKIVLERHRDCPGSVFYKGKTCWTPAPLDTTRWKSYWIYAFLELTVDSKIHYSESFASLLNANVASKVKIDRNTPVHKLGLPTRIFGRIRAANIHTVEELFRYRWRAMENWSNFGKLSMFRLVDKMSQYELE